MNTKRMIKTKGKSMQEIICYSDYLIYELFDASPKLHFGDIAVYNAGQAGLAAHRFLFRTKNHCFLVGDNCRHFEKHPLSSLYGRGLIVIRGNCKYDMNKKTLFRTWYTLLLLAVVVINNFALHYLLDQRNTVRCITRLAARIHKHVAQFRSSMQKKLLKRSRME